jgi:hypothetical protein
VTASPQLLYDFGKVDARPIAGDDHLGARQSGSERFALVRSSHDHRAVERRYRGVDPTAATHDHELGILRKSELLAKTAELVCGLGEHVCRRPEMIAVGMQRACANQHAIGKCAQERHHESVGAVRFADQ